MHVIHVLILTVYLCRNTDGLPTVDTRIEVQTLLVMGGKHVSKQVVLGHLLMLAQGRFVICLLLQLIRVVRIHRDVRAGPRWSIRIIGRHANVLRVRLNYHLLCQVI